MKLSQTFWLELCQLNNRIITYKFEQFLEDPQADSGTGMLIMNGLNFCFTLKQPHRWGRTEAGDILLPFGGIGGKIEKNESPLASLHREALEEVSSDVKVIGSGGRCIMIDQQSLQVINLYSELSNEPLPEIIFRSPRAEIGRKPFTNVLIYRAAFVSDRISPLDDPAILEIDQQLLVQLVDTPMTVAEFKRCGGKINSKINLPEAGLFQPVGTALAIARCLRAGLITLTTTKNGGK